MNWWGGGLYGRWFSGRGFGLCQRRLGQLDVGDGPLRRIARNGGIIADGGQSAGVDAFDRLSRR